jgi:beta-N-acetylhexosaminidase
MAKTMAEEPGPNHMLDQMLGQMLMVGFRGATLSDDDPIVRDVTSGRVGGVVLFDYDSALKVADRNVKNPDQLRKLTAFLQARSEVPLFIAVDQEGGRVQRLKPKYGFPAFPSAQELGRYDADAAEAVGAGVGGVLAKMGINLNFAPVADVNVNPDSPAIGRLGRSFSPNPKTVARQCQAFIQGMRWFGVLSCLKHFPGHGSSQADSHLGVTDITNSWSPAELVPYEQLLAQGEVDMVMTGHLFNGLLDPNHPATLSNPTITGVLRNTLGFQGVVVSDDMQMKAISDAYGLERVLFLAVDAGVDILLFANNLEYDPEIARKAHALLKKMVLEGRISRERIRRSFDRIMTLKEQLK